MLLKKIESFINQNQLINSGDTIIVGLSGGPDSVFLLHVLHTLTQQYNLKLIAAHLDHQWRSDSSHDVAFCKKLATSLGVVFESNTLKNITQEKVKGSAEATARKARRIFFESLAQKYHAQSIALAHHLNDQEETFFIRLIRGSSLTGLTCMWPRQGRYIRPLLEITKDEIVGYLANNNITYLQDPTNDSPSFLRNRIRMQVLPALRECDKRFDLNFLATLNRLQMTEQYLQHQTDELYAGIKNANNGNMYIEITNLLAAPQDLRFRTLLKWLIEQKVPFPISTAFLEEIIRFFIDAKQKEHAVHHAWKIVKDGDFAHILRLAQDERGQN